MNTTTGNSSRLSRKGVVIVVPALAEGQDPDLRKLGKLSRHPPSCATCGCKLWLDSIGLTRTQPKASQLFIERSPGLKGLGGRSSDFAARSDATDGSRTVAVPGLSSSLEIPRPQASAHPQENDRLQPRDSIDRMRPCLGLPKEKPTAIKESDSVPGVAYLRF